MWIELRLPVDFDIDYVTEQSKRKAKERLIKWERSHCVFCGDDDDGFAVDAELLRPVCRICSFAIIHNQKGEIL